MNADRQENDYILVFDMNFLSFTYFIFNFLSSGMGESDKTLNVFFLKLASQRYKKHCMLIIFTRAQQRIKSRYATRCKSARTIRNCI